MNKKLIEMSLASVIVSANQGCLAENIGVTAKGVMNRESENDNTITLKGINMKADQLKGKLSKGNTIKLIIPEKIDGKQVVLAPMAFYNLDMNGASLELKFVGKVKLPSDCSGMFARGYDNESPITGIDFGDVDTSDVANMYGMFIGCEKLKSLNVSNFNTQNVQNMRSMFEGCGNLTSLVLSSFNTQNVTAMGCMFYKCSNLTTLDLSSFKTENVKNMNGMFWNCKNLKSLDLSSFDTKNVSDMDCMFSGCANLISLDLVNFNTQNITDMSCMFSECGSLNHLDLSSFNTENVTDMSCMFSNCASLTSLDLSNFNTQNVKNMGGMFRKCSSLESLDLSNFSTQNVNDMNRMFNSCRSLKSLDLRSFNKENVKDDGFMFKDCPVLKTLTINTDSFGEDISLDLLRSNGVNIIDVASLTGKRNALNQIYWRIVANNMIVTADPDGEHSWIKNTDKYWKSIVEVIGKAIGDCVTKQNEFANPTENELIVFKASPERYERKHWNAVLLYNFVYQIITKNNTISTEQLLDDVIAKLSKHYTSPDASSNLNDELDRAKRDIIEYDSALNLRDRLNEYSNTSIDYERYWKSRWDIKYLAPRLSYDGGATYSRVNGLAPQEKDRNYVEFAPDIRIEENNEQRTVLRPYFYGYNDKKLTISKVYTYRYTPTGPEGGDLDFKSFKTYNTRVEISENCGPLKNLFGDLVEFYDE